MEFVGGFLALQVGRVVFAVFLDDLVAGINAMAIVFVLEQQVCFILHSGQLVPEALGGGGGRIYIVKGLFPVLKAIVTSA